MLYKGYDFFPHHKKWNILGWRNLCVGASVAFMMLSVVMLGTRGLNYGVDFKGGTLFEIQAASGQLDIAGIRNKLNHLNIGDVQVQGVGVQGTEALVRVGQQANEKVQLEAAAKVRAALGDGVNFRRTETVGPTVSSELFWTGTTAVVLSLFGILVYVWFRFEWQFAVAGIAALFHDVLVTAGMFSILWYEFDLATVAALLTLAGYSINDTVVTFDRVRENLRKYKRTPLEDLLNNSVNETLSRTIMTAGSTFLAVLALWLFGTEAIQGFAFAMLFGVIIGTYSSIYVAAPLILWLGVSRESFSGARDPAAASVSAGAGARAPKSGSKP
jgi:preprotein translocase subunit SecF